MDAAARPAWVSHFKAVWFWPPLTAIASTALIAGGVRVSSTAPGESVVLALPLLAAVFEVTAGLLCLPIVLVFLVFYYSVPDQLLAYAPSTIPRLATRLFVVTLGVGLIAKARRAEAERDRLRADAGRTSDPLTTVFERVSDGFVALDANWHYTYVNQKAATLLHRDKPEDLIGKHIWTEYPEGVGQPFARAYREATETQQTIVFEDYYAPWDSWYENRVYPSPDGLTIYFSDVTERKRVERATREAEERLRLAVQAANIGLWDWDLSTNRLRYSPEWKRQIGYEDHEISEDFSEWQHRVHPDDLDRLLSRVRAFLENPWPDFQVEGRLRHKDGSYRWILVRGALLRDEQGRPVRMLGANLDITEHRNAEEAVRQSEKRLRILAPHLLTAREEERAGVAREIHDELGQALTGLKMDVAWIGGRLADAGLQAKVQGMRALLDDTIAAVRRISTELRPAILDDLGLAAAVEWQVQEFERRAGVRCIVQTSLDRALPADVSIAAFRILQEALTNAARHARATAVDVSFGAEGDCLCLEIKDNGVGIEMERVRGARSFGLLGMRERAELLGGTFAIRGSPGAGTRVSVRLPIGLSGG